METKGLLNSRRLVPVGALLLFALIGYALHGVLIALLIALVAAYLLNPLVDRLENLGMSRRVGALLVMLTFMGLLLFVVFVGLPSVVKDALDVSSRFPAQLEALRLKVGTWVSDRFHVEVPQSLGDIVTTAGRELRSLAPNPSDIAGAFSRTLGAIAAALASLIIPIFAYYLLIDFNAMVRYARKLVPRRFSASIESFAKEINLVLSRYVQGQALKSAILAVLYATALGLLDIRMAIPFGILLGLLTFVPYIGVTVGTLLVVLLSLLDWRSANHFWAVLAALAVIGVVDNQFITPRVLGGRAPLKSIEMLLTMIGAAALFGGVGVLFAVPLGAVIKILLRRIVQAYVKSRFYSYIPQDPPAEEPAAKAPPLGREPAIAAAAQVVNSSKPEPALSGISRFTSLFSSRKL